MAVADLCFLPATELARHIRNGDLSSREVVAAHLEQIERVNPTVNAIVTLVAEQALADAAVADEVRARGEAIGPLHGLPVAHKDMHLTKGIRTTFGSPIFKDFIPEQDDLVVQRLKNAGAITMGKTNTPEFGAGSQTYNEVFGPALNPYDTSKTCGGSSGGAAVALACGMAALADGSDMGGSLRNPASFCNVTGFRPSPGRVPLWPAKAGWDTLTVQGPMARTVADVALMLSVLAGFDQRSPISIDAPAERFSRPLEREFRGVRIAWSRDLGGLPVDPAVSGVIESQRHVFESLGCAIEDAEPDFSNADRIFSVLRAWSFELLWGRLLETNRHQMKDTLVWNIEEGRRLTPDDLRWAEIKRTALFQRVAAFMETYEFLILPVSQVPPFPIEQQFIEQINDVRMDTYIDWMKSCYYISVLSLPAISAPCGFTPGGLPVGVQIVGRHRDELGVLQLAHAFEYATAFWKHRPPVAAS
jgi:amidase